MEKKSGQLQPHEMIIQYEGYKGINLERFNVNQLRNLKQILQMASNMPEYARINSDMASLPSLSLEEIKNKTKEFCLKYFNLHDINFTTMDSIRKIVNQIPITAKPEEAYRIINSVMEKKSPLDLEVRLTNGHAMSGKIVKPIPLIENMINDDNREMCFSHIEIGAQLNPLSVGTLVHEVTHAEQEQNIGYAEDYLNKEIISIFLEKVNAMEMDPSGNLLKLSERARLTDLLVRYSTLLLKPNSVTELQKIDNLMYIKSILNAEKLFDMYINERKQKNKDKYFTMIQDVFDGKITVEDMLRIKNITTNNSQDFGMLKRHL